MAYYHDYNRVNSELQLTSEEYARVVAQLRNVVDVAKQVSVADLERLLRTVYAKQTALQCVVPPATPLTDKLLNDTETLAIALIPLCNAVMVTSGKATG